MEDPAVWYQHPGEGTLGYVTIKANKIYKRIKLHVTEPKKWVGFPDNTQLMKEAIQPGDPLEAPLTHS